MEVKYSDLPEQFPRNGALRNDILRDIETLVDTGDYTLGKAVGEFEEAFAKFSEVKHAIGVRSGTDALYLTLKALNIKQGHVGVTVPNTFVATAAAIELAGADVQFVDVGDDMLMPHYETFPILPEVILPVDWGGDVVDMDEAKIMNAGVRIVHDACQAIGATLDGTNVANLGHAAAFSLHPLKNLNVWGDGGVVTTNSDVIADRVRRLRDHGKLDRDTYPEFSFNARLETIQAIVGKHVLKGLDEVTERRIANAKHYDALLKGIKGIEVPERKANVRHVYHLYQIFAEDRDSLQAFLGKNGIEAKVHYPKPLHLQPAMKNRYIDGDFPVAEWQSKRILTLPIHQHLTEAQIDYVALKVREFAKGH